MKKPDWKIEFDKQVAECSMTIAKLYREYPEPVVHAALNKEASLMTAKQQRERFEEQYDPDDSTDSNTD